MTETDAVGMYGADDFKENHFGMDACVMETGIFG